MKPPELGNPRLEYVPLPASPIAIAILIITLVVAAIGLPLWTVTRGDLDLWWLWVVPPILVIAAIILGRPTPLRIFDLGLELPLPLWKRLVGSRRLYGYDEIVNLYPRLYYVSGALLSPFAASAGTVEHLGLGIEFRGGKETVLTFTPSVPQFARGEDEGYRLVAQELREAFDALGRPWVMEVSRYSDEDVERMKRAAVKPLMPFFVISMAFFSPVAIIPLLYVGLTTWGGTLTASSLAVIVILGIAPMVSMLLISWRRSVRRHRYLREISKFQEWKRSAKSSTV